MQQKMASKIHANMFRTKGLNESDGQNNAALSLALRKWKNPFLPLKLLIRRGARLHSHIVTCFCSCPRLLLLAARFRFQQTNRHAPCRRESDADGDWRTRRRTRMPSRTDTDVDGQGRTLADRADGRTDGEKRLANMYAPRKKAWPNTSFSSGM